MPKIYTKTGDQGETSLFSGERVSKSHERIQVLGALDELNAAIGLSQSFGDLPKTLFEELTQIQNDLFSLGAQVAFVASEKRKEPLVSFKEEASLKLEKQIDQHQGNLPELRNFILPSGGQGACVLHLARSICRRAERQLVEIDGIDSRCLIYINRLSDYLFVAARVANHEQGKSETIWKS